MNLKRSILTCAAVLSLLFAVSLFAEAESFPRLIPDPEIALVGVMVEPLPVETIILAALRVSGVSAAEFDSVFADIKQLLADAEGEIDRDEEPALLAERILQFLHNTTFDVYDEFQTRIDIAVKSGRFNCVSSAVMYMILARYFDIPVIGIGTADHAFCAVVLPGRVVDVETTTVYGFDPGRKKEFQDAFGNVTGYSYVPPSNYSGRNELGERELLGLILQNRISFLEARKEYGAAVALAVDRYALAPLGRSRTHLFKEIANFAALLNERREYSPAIDFLTKAVDEYGRDESFGNIFEILHYNRAVTLIQAEKPREAIAAVDLAHAEVVRVTTRPGIGIAPLESDVVAKLVWKTTQADRVPIAPHR